MEEIIPRRFIALSDSASLFVPSWQPARLMHFIMETSARVQPRVCYVGAAKGDDPKRISEFYYLASRIGFVPQVLSFFEFDDGNPDSFFAEADIIYIDGGSTRNLLAILREWGADAALVKAYNGGIPVVGASAGASIMFEWCLTDSIRTDIRPHPGLGIIPGTVCAHYGARPERQSAFFEFASGYRARFPAWAIEDGVALEFENEKMVRGVTVNEAAGALRMDERTGILSHIRAVCLNPMLDLPGGTGT